MGYGVDVDSPTLGNEVTSRPSRFMLRSTVDVVLGPGQLGDTEQYELGAYSDGKWGRSELNSQLRQD